MYPPSPNTTIVIPFKDGPVDQLGPIVNDAYFGKVPPKYLKVEADKGRLFMKGDGTHRSKIGISPLRSLGIAGSYDSATKTLNLVLCGKPKPGAKYVNSMWELQDKPFSGDAINSYNDVAPPPQANRRWAPSTSWKLLRRPRNSHLRSR